MTRTHICNATLLALLLGTAQSAAANTVDHLIQPPTLAPPERGAVTGSLARLSYGPAELGRGSFVLPSPFEAPEERGPLLADVFPTYSIEAGISEWGMGWQADLAIVHAPVVGDVDYAVDEFTSPWGRLVAGDDGFFYPSGLRVPVRLQRQDSGFTAILPDGTRMVFDQRVETDQGTYAWYLGAVENVLGDRTALAYEASDTGRLYLAAVTYGARGRADYRLRFTHEPLEYAFVDYRAGAPLTLDRRVVRVDVEARHAETGAFEARWHYDLGYEPSPFGPAFYLAAVTRVFASGEVEPPVRYAYDLGAEQFENASFVHLPGLDAYLGEVGSGGLQANRVTQIDLGLDGILDLEFHTDQRRVRFDGNAWVTEPLPVMDGAISDCRTGGGELNLPRTLAYMTPEAETPHVVHTDYDIQTVETLLIVCDEFGRPLYQDSFFASWELSSKRRLADINRDHRPDLIRVGYGYAEVLENQSDASGFAFAEFPEQELSPAIDSETVWIHDVNGDGLVDIIARWDISLVVWYGLGHARFVREGELFWLYTSLGYRISNLAGFGLYFGDFNKDGLIDLLVTGSSEVSVFLNTGTAFQEYEVPALEAVPYEISRPAIGDFSGDGDLDVVYVEQQQAHALSLVHPGTGLMRAADDGKGTVIHFEYGRAAPHEGLGHRPVVLSAMTVESSGHGEVVTYRYDYAAPVVHSRGRFLVGFDVARKEAPFLTEEVRFHNDDDVAGLVTETLALDSRTPGLGQFSATDHDEHALAGVRWLRPRVGRAGWRSPADGHELVETTEYQTYERDICPTQVVSETGSGTLVHETLLADVPALGDALHCLPQHERLAGHHEDAGHDFVHEHEIARNAFGQVTFVRQHGNAGTQTLQTVTYDDAHRVQAVTRPGRGSTAVAYETATGLVHQVIAPDGVAVRASVRAPVTDGLLALVTERGPGGVLAASYRYDAHERLAAAWQDFGGSSEAAPLLALRYAYPSRDGPGSIVTRAFVDAGSLRETADYVAADGAALGTATRIPEGWAFADVLAHERSTRTAFAYRRPMLAGESDPAGLGYAAFYPEAAVLLGRTEAAGFGHAAFSESTVQNGVTRTVEQALSLDGGELVTTAVENDAYSTRSATDAAGNVHWVQDEAGAITRFVHDALGRIVGVDLADGQVHRVAYDDYGRVARLERDGIGVITYAYAPETGLLQTMGVHGTDGALERSATYAYDDAGRVTTETHTLATTGETRRFLYDYDGADDPDARGQRGHLTRVRGDAYEQTTRHNPDGTVARTELRLADWRAVTYETDYYANGEPRRIRRVLRDLERGVVLQEHEQSIAYDAHGRLRTLSIDGQALATVVYDGEGRIDRIELASGAAVIYSYDPVTHEPNGFWHDNSLWNAGVEWTLDARALVARELVSFNGAYRDRAYGYDARGFLTAATDAESSARYTYTSSGLPATADDVLGQRSVNRTGAQSIDAGGTVYEVDALGRIARKGDLAFDYGPAGELAAARRGDTLWGFHYGHAGNRLLKTENGRPVAAYVDGGYLTADQFITPVHVAGHLLGVLEGSTFHLLAVDGRGTVLADRDGTPRLATPYGVRTQRADLSAALDYVEKGYDADLGTVRMGARDYDPLLGQFHTPDPLYLADPARCLASPVACNLYSYAANNPLLLVDPTGYDAWRWIKEKAAAAGRFGAGVGRGVGAGAADTVVGVYTMVRHPVRTAEGIAHAVWHPVETGRAVWGVIETTAQAVAQGDPETIGRVLFEAGVAVASGGVASGVGKIDKLTDAARIADKAGDAAKSAARGGGRATTRFIDDVTVTSHGRVVGRGTVDVGPTIEAIESGRLAPRNIFQNRPLPGRTTPELPVRPPGYYQEFVHPTPGVWGVGPQRIVRGQGGELYYTPDHYQTFIPLN
jgi:RHS repeat-associated protein